MTESEKGPWKNHSRTPHGPWSLRILAKRPRRELETTVFTWDHSLFALGLSSTCILRVYLGLKEKREDGKRNSTPPFIWNDSTFNYFFILLHNVFKTITTLLPNPFPLGFLFRCGRLTTCISLLPFPLNNIQRRKRKLYKHTGTRTQERRQRVRKAKIFLVDGK